MRRCPWGARWHWPAGWPRATTPRCNGPTPHSRPCTLEQREVRGRKGLGGCQCRDPASCKYIQMWLICTLVTVFTVQKGWHVSTTEMFYAYMPTYMHACRPAIRFRFPRLHANRERKEKKLLHFKFSSTIWQLDITDRKIKKNNICKLTQHMWVNHIHFIHTLPSPRTVRLGALSPTHIIKWKSQLGLR